MTADPVSKSGMTVGDWVSIGALVVNATFAFLNARQALKTGQLQKDLHDLATRPLLAVTGISSCDIATVKTDQYGEGDFYPVLLEVTNVGNAPATMWTLDMSLNLQANLGAPISLPSKGTSHVKVWLHQEVHKSLTGTLENMIPIKLEIHYWDFQEQGYTLGADLQLGWERLSDDARQHKGHFFVQAEKTAPIPKELSKPAVVQGWPRANGRFRTPSILS